MTIIAGNNPAILTAIAESDELRSGARAIINGETEADESVLGPLCQIIELSLTELPSEIEIGFTFLMNLLTFCESESVYRLFESLITLSDTQDAISRFFLSRGLVHAIARCVRDDSDDVCIERLYNLMSLCLTIPALQEECFSPVILQFALDTLDETEGPVQAAQWKLLARLLKRETAETLASACLRGTNVICANVQAIHQCQVEALNFVTALYRLDHALAQQIDNEQVITSLTQWFQTFLGHTIALDAVCRFMETVMGITGLSELVLKLFVPVVVASVEKGNRVQIAFAIRWARQVWAAAQGCELATALARETDFMHFCLSTVGAADRILKKQYGADPKGSE
jgi:hypothetical protein